MLKNQGDYLFFGLSLFYNLNPYGYLLSDMFASNWYKLYENAGAANKEAAKRVYETHNQEVKNYVKSENLLVFKAKDGWAPLCKFLNVPIPNVPYPRSNSANELYMTFIAVNIMGYLTLGLYVYLGVRFFVKSIL